MNIKRLDSPSYRTYRVLRAPTVIGDCYRARVKQFGSIRGAIIFPEAILGITHKLYRAGVTTNSAQLAQLTISTIEPRLTFKGEEVTSVEQILDIENEWPLDKTPEEMFKLRNSLRHSEHMSFFGNPLFSNKEAVTKFVTLCLPGLLNDLKG